MTARLRLTFLLATAACALLAALAAARWLFPAPDRPLPWKMDGRWITPAREAGPVGYFRKTLDLPAQVRSAWIAVAARDAFELSVNGAVLAGDNLWRPNRAFQFTSSERGQRVNDARPIPGVPYPREYQWAPQASWKVPVFIDISRHLQRGRNVVCLRVDARAGAATMRVAGSVALTSGDTFSLASDGGWKADALPRLEAGVDWLEEAYNDRAWSAAAIQPGPEDFYRVLDPAVFAQPFAGQDLAASTTASAVTLETTWQLEEVPREAWLRLAVNRAYDLSINDEPVRLPSFAAGELAAGSWLPRTLLATGPRATVVALDPEDADTLFDEAARERSGIIASPDLLRDGQVETFDACEVTPLLRRGANRITLRLVDRGAKFQWSPRAAIDGLARGAHTVTPLASSATTWRAADASGPVFLAESPRRAEDMLQLRYLGSVVNGSRPLPWVAALLTATGAVVFARRQIRALDATVVARFSASLLVAIAVLAGGFVVDACLAMRDDALWMAQPPIWLALLALAALSAGATWLWLSRSARWSPPRATTLAVLLLILVTCGFTRAYRADFQSTDADEWASLQTILAIAETGTPRLTDEAYYTRSPFYHYLTAGAVKLFGPTFWALRLPGAVFAVATCALLYLCGARLLRSRWVGLGAAALFALHPLAIDMGHQVRFYQQQQFFALLTFYFFCRGFVSSQRLGARYAMLAAFFAAVFSQEISVMMVFAFFPAYLLFARGRPWREEAGWLLAGACGMVFVVLDFVIFQTVCLTRLDGVSPRIEPALGLNFMYPSTLYWIFSLYSRLHVGLSVLFFAGLPFVLRSRNRAVRAMVLTFFSGLIFTTILITGPGVRFQYWLFPLFFLLAVFGAQQLAAAAVRALRPFLAGGHRPAQWSLGAVAVVVVLLSFSPWKLLGSYETKLLPDVDSAFALVRQKLAPGDAVAVAAPHTAAAMCELGRVDYDVELPLLHDFVYRKNGRLIDRNGGAQVMARLDDLQEAMARHERLWVVLNRDIRFRSPGSRIAWQNPGARFDLFVRTNLELVHQSYLTDVFLWDPSKGRLHGFREAF